MNFSKYATFVFDLDGTIWDVLRLIPGASRIVSHLRAAKKNVLFVSNHTMYGRKEIAARLRRMGLQVGHRDIINSGYSVATWLKAKGVKKVMVFGKGMRDDLKEEGIEATDKLPVKYVVLGHDPEMNYKKLGRIYEAVRDGATVLSTAPGRLFFVGDKWYPGMGAFNAAIEFMTNKKVVVLGKPSGWMLHLIRKRVRGKTVIFGDEINSDIPFGKKAGWTTVLVLTGVDKSTKGEAKPDYILRSVADIKI